MNIPEFRAVSGVLPFLEKNKRYIGIGAFVLIGWVIGLLISNFIESSIWANMPGVPAPRVEKNQEMVIEVPPFENYAVIIERNFFEVDVDRIAPPPPPEPIADSTTKEVVPEEIKISPLPAEVIGTMGGNEEVAVALIRDKRNKQVDLYWVGDSLFDQATILEIRRAEVLILRNGQTELLQLYDDDSLVKIGRAGDKKAAKSKGKRDSKIKDDKGLIKDAATDAGDVQLTVQDIGNNQFVIDKAEFDQVMNNLGPLLTQARVVPNFSKGKINGYKVFAIKAGSLFQQIGLKNGDIIHNVNGVGLDTPEKALQLFQQLRAETDFDLDIERGGEEQAFGYQLR